MKKHVPETYYFITTIINRKHVVCRGHHDGTMEGLLNLFTTLGTFVSTKNGISIKFELE